MNVRPLLSIRQIVVRRIADALGEFLLGKGTLEAPVK
jgi:hypothetical protein